MTMIAYKYRIYPTAKQEEQLVGWLGQLRFVWNKLLSDNQTQYAATKTFAFLFEMKRKLPQMKKDYNWIDAPSQALQNKVFDLDQAMKNCFKFGRGFPKFKSKHYDNSGIEISQVAQIDKDTNQVTYRQIRWDDQTISIPKLGKMKWVYHRRIKGRLLSITIKRDVDQWYVCCLAKQEANKNNAIVVDEKDCVGLDLGLKDFFVSSDGPVAPTPKIYRSKQEKLKQRQRRLSRKKKGSANRNKARIKIARLHRTIRNTRLDWHHKLSNLIAKNYSVVLVEDLNINGMIKNRKLAKAIQDQGWAQFVTLLSYKLEWNNGLLHKIDRWAASTKTCNCCGSKKTLTLSERTYVCSNCDNVMDRDLNAAINIKNWGIDDINTAGTAGIYACGDTAVGDISREISRHVSFETGTIPSLEGSCWSSDQQ
jgi:putative transposase